MLNINGSLMELKNLVKTSNFLDDLLNQERNKFAPFVGKYAFAHKGGLHVSAVTKNPECYEHINPESVGNKRQIMISNQAGRSNVISRLKDIGIDPDKDIKFSQISDLVNKVKDLEAKGYAFDGADASFELLVNRSLSVVPSFFELISFRVLNERKFNKSKKEDLSCSMKRCLNIPQTDIPESVLEEDSFPEQHV